MLNIEDLKIGDELECIDVDGYINQDVIGAVPSTRKMVLDEQLVIGSFCDSGAVIICNSNFRIPNNALQFFAKKKEEKTLGFDDLIDVAVQAYKDGVLVGVALYSVGFRRVRYWRYGFAGVDGDKREDYKESIDAIKSLYNETFTIDQSNDNLQRVKIGATIKNHPSGKQIVLEDQDAVDDLYAAPYWMTNGLIIEQPK